MRFGRWLCEEMTNEGRNPKLEVRSPKSEVRIVLVLLLVLVLDLFSKTKNRIEDEEEEEDEDEARSCNSCNHVTLVSHSLINPLTL
jgi:hypothetical protein